MKVTIRKIFLCFASMLSLSATANTSDETRYQNLTQELRCLVCQNETLADSDAPLAKDLRKQIQSRIDQGETDTQIIQYLTARYGEFILFKPSNSPKNYPLWLSPFFFLIIGIMTMSLVISQQKKRRKKQNPLTDEEKNTLKSLLK